MHCHLNWAFHVAQQYFFLIVFVQFPLPPPKQLFQGFVTIVHPYSFIVITMGSFPFCITRPLPISKRENRIQCTKIRLLPNPWCQNLIHPCLQLLRSFLLSQRHSHHWCSLRFTPCSCPGPIITPNIPSVLALLRQNHFEIMHLFTVTLFKMEALKLWTASAAFVAYELRKVHGTW